MTQINIQSKQRPGSFGWMLQQPKPPAPQRPITPKENMRRVVAGEKPLWMPAIMFEVDYCWSDIVLEHPQYEYDGFDWYGTQWVWVEIAGGMMVKPNTRVLSEITRWREEVVFPDLDAIDWQKDAAEQKARYSPDRMHVFQCTEGIFERLHELMPFEETLAAMVEEPECVKEFFHAVADFKIKLLDKIFTYYEPIDYVIYNDDWGTQRAGFFSPAMFNEMILPETKRIIQFIKSRGKFAELHSCGRTQCYIEQILDMGFDAWTPQSVNDSDFLKSNYGHRLTLGLIVEGLDRPGITEAQARRCVRDFVDKYGPGGRCMAFAMCPPELMEAVSDELYSYSLAFYAK